MGQQKPAAGYLRVSKAREEMQAPAIYRGQIEDYCKYKRLHLAEVFSDVDYSGRRGAKARPGLEALLERRQEFSAVVVPKLSRFGRSLRDLAELFATFDDDGIGLIFLDVDVDSRSSTGRLVRNIMASLAEYEGDLIGERWSDIHKHLAREGRVPGGTTLPYGFTYDKETKVVRHDGEQAKVVREIFKRYLAGESVRAIVADLNRRKIPTRDVRPGKRWYPTTVKNMLVNPAYAGLRPYDGGLIAAKWKPIVARDKWERARELRETSTKAKEPPQRTPDYLLSGLIKCGICGASCHHMAKRGHRPEMYTCSRSPHYGGDCKGGGISARRAEQIVTDAFLAFAAEPFRKRVGKEPRRKFQTEDKDAREADKLRKEIARIDRQAARLVDELKDAPKVKARAINAEFGELETRREEAERSLARLTLHQQRGPDAEHLKAEIKNLPRIWDRMTTQQRRAIIQAGTTTIQTVPGTRPKQLRVEFIPLT